MYSYHLWIVLRESTTESDTGSLSSKLADLSALIGKKMASAVPSSPLSAINNEHVLQCSASHNHRGDVHDRLLSVLEWLAHTLPGSYGLVYWNDDERPGRHVYDGYNVLVVARGSVAQRYDPFLSPVAPVVED